MFIFISPPLCSCNPTFFLETTTKPLLRYFLTCVLEHCVLTVAPQILPFEFGENPINSGDLTSLTCSVNKGDLPIALSWLHNNKTIGNDEGITVMQMNKKISTLSIDYVQAEHAGEYVCLAKNSAGIARHSAYLKVNG